MKRTTILRGLAVLALAAVGACDTTRSPTAAEPTAVRPLATIVSGFNITDSGGYPLLSWSALTGATSYTVRLITYQTLNGSYRYHWFNTLGTVTGTSFLDGDRTYTGTHECTAVLAWPDGTDGQWYEYELFANFTNGTSSPVRRFAPVALPNCYYF